MGKDVLLHGNNTILEAAVLGAQLDRGTAPFRQRDVRQFEHLLQYALRSDEPIHNTQIMRLLKNLVLRGWVQSDLRGRQPMYRLSRQGLIGLTTSLTDQVETRQGFLIVSYFFASYGHLLMHDVPQSLKVDLEAKISPAALQGKRLAVVEHQIKMWQARIDDLEALLDNAKRWQAEGMPWKQILKKMNEQFPFEDRPSHSLEKAVRGLNFDRQQWEVFNGNALRIRSLWQPHVQMLVAEREMLLS